MGRGQDRLLVPELEKRLNIPPHVAPRPDRQRDALKPERGECDNEERHAGAPRADPAFERVPRRERGGGGSQAQRTSGGLVCPLARR